MYTVFLENKYELSKHFWVFWQKFTSFFFYQQWPQYAVIIRPHLETILTAILSATLPERTPKKILIKKIYVSVRQKTFFLTKNWEFFSQINERRKVYFSGELLYLCKPMEGMKNWEWKLRKRTGVCKGIVRFEGTSCLAEEVQKGKKDMDENFWISDNGKADAAVKKILLSQNSRGQGQQITARRRWKKIIQNVIQAEKDSGTLGNARRPLKAEEATRFHHSL